MEPVMLFMELNAQFMFAMPDERNSSAISASVSGSASLIELQ
jgi:hypothetical protein